MYISTCIREITHKQVLGLEYIRKGILKKINGIKSIELQRRLLVNCIVN